MSLSGDLGLGISPVLLQAVSLKSLECPSDRLALKKDPPVMEKQPNSKVVTHLLQGMNEPVSALLSSSSQIALTAELQREKPAAPKQEEVLLNTSIQERLANQIALKQGRVVTTATIGGSPGDVSMVNVLTALASQHRRANIKQEEAETFASFVQPTTTTTTPAAADVVVRTHSDSGDERSQPQIIIYYNSGSGSVPSPANDVIVGEVEGEGGARSTVQNFRVVMHPGDITTSGSTVTTLSEPTMHMISEAAAATTAMTTEASGTFVAADSNSSETLTGNCPVCGDKLSGYHYGVFTCESCKGFFKRTVQNKKSFMCHKQGNCEVNVFNRKKCPSCRFTKCLQTGMKLEAIRQDRTRGGRSSYDGCSPHNKPRPAPTQKKGKRPSGAGGEEGSRSGVVTPVPEVGGLLTAKDEGKSHRQLVAILNHSNTHGQQVADKQGKRVPELLTDIMNLEALLTDEDLAQDGVGVEEEDPTGEKAFYNYLMQLTELRLYKLVRWARNLPQFGAISTDDQILLLQNCWSDLLALGVCWRSVTTPTVLSISATRSISLEQAEALGFGDVVNRLMSVAQSLRNLRVDQIEYVALKVLLLITPGVKTTPFLLVGSSDHITQIPTTNIGHLNMRQLSTPRLQGLRVMGVNPVTQEIIVGAQTLRGRPVLMKTSSIWSSTFTVTVIEDDADYLGSPISLAVDWAADQVFWLCEHRNTVEIIQTNGESRSQLTFEGVGGLKSIAISVDLGLLFYSVWGKHPKVVQCHMDGANCTIIHNAYYLSQPTHLLFYNQRIYWSDLKSESVSSLPYLGTEKKTEITKRSLQNFAVYNNLYFHDNTTESIHLYNMEEKTSVTDYDLPDMDIRDLVLLVPREKDLEFPCAQNNGGCSDICLSLPEKKRRCLCPLEKHLATNQQTCLVTEMICPSHQILCKSSYTCLSKSKLCLQMVSCRELATPVECMHNELEPSKEEEENECPEVNVCDQFCFLTSRGPVCSCDVGYKLASDGRACTDVDECAERNGHCSQLCHNKRGSHSCSCVQGYSLISDRVTCHSTDHDGAYLIVTTSLGLIVVEMDGEREYPLLLRKFPPISFDVSLQEDWQSYHAVMQRAAKHPLGVPFRTNFIWSEQLGTYIQRYAGSVSELSTMGLKVTVVRVDQVTKNVYFVTQQQETRYSIVVCDNALSQCVAVMTEQKWKPISLVLHPANRMMYWVDKQSHSLGAAYMDGQGKGAVSGDVRSMPDGLTLCAVRERLYWLDGRDPTTSTIHTVKVDGSDRYMLGTFLQRKLVSLDLFEGYLYLTDRVAHSVFKISTFSSRPVLSEMRRMDSSVRHLRMVHSPPKIPNLCAMYRCSDLCLLGRKGARCMCPQHVLFAHSPEGCNHKKSRTPPHHPETPEQVLPPQVPPLVFTTPPVPLPGATSTSRASATTPWRGPPVRPPHEVCWGFCLNGAFCQAVNGKPACSCGIGFAGRRCETVVPTKGGDDGPLEEGIGIHASNKSSAVGPPTPPSTTPSGGLSAAAVVGIVLGLLALGALAVGGGIFFRKRRAERHNYAGVEYKMENDEAFLVPGNEGSSYYKWDLGGSLLDIPTTSLDSAAFRTTANPVFNRNPVVFSRHPAYHPLGSTD